MQTERDGSILLGARYPQRALEWLARKRTHLADAQSVRLYRGCDQGIDWDADDPRVDHIVTYAERRYEDESVPTSPAPPPPR